MSYNDIAAMAHDGVLRHRIIACAAQEFPVNETPTAWVDEHIWKIVSASDWDAAYSYARGAGTENPGGSESVITDEMILARVQAIKTEYGGSNG